MPKLQPPPEFSLIHTQSLSADRLTTVPHPTWAYRRSPSASLSTISSTLWLFFSKFFSSFPRGTCSLSGSHLYLALDGIHHQIWAAFPNNPTLRQHLVVRQGLGPTGLSPSPAPLSRGLGPSPPLRTLLQTTIQTAKPFDSKAGLFPFHSPLLRKSL